MPFLPGESVMPDFGDPVWIFLCTSFIESDFYKNHKKELKRVLEISSYDDRQRAAALYDYCMLMQETFLAWSNAMQNVLTELDNERMMK